MAKQVFNGQGYPHVIPRPGYALSVLKMLEESKDKELPISTIASRLGGGGASGRHVYGAVFMLRRKFGVPITTLTDDAGHFSYRLDKPVAALPMIEEALRGAGAEVV